MLLIVNEAQDAKLADVYPWVNPRPQEYKKMELWLAANRPGRKVRNVPAFAQNWFNKIPARHLHRKGERVENSQGQHCSANLPLQDARISRELIRGEAVRFGVMFEKDIAPLIPIWDEAFGSMASEDLLSLFQRAMRTCTFFPKIAEILEPLNAVEQADYEDEWQALLDYCREWVHPDIHFSGAPELPVEIDHAARAAGGVQFLRACSSEELGWRKKLFIEDLTRSRKTGDLAGLLTGGELRKLLRKPLGRCSTARCYSIHSAIAAARASMESTGDVLTRMVAPIRETPRSVDFEGRRATQTPSGNHSRKI